MTEKEKKTNSKKSENKNNTMILELTNSKGNVITAVGSCSDKEIKAICKALYHTPDQKVEIK